jgi:hypothetical protein
MLLINMERRISKEIYYDELLEREKIYVDIEWV